MQGWQNVPETTGRRLRSFNRTLIGDVDFLSGGRHTPAQAAAFPQWWLFFGLLSGVIYKLIPLIDFT
jgi:hypothetical protein